MRSLFLSAALGVGALFGLSPAQADASWLSHGLRGDRSYYYESGYSYAPSYGNYALGTSYYEPAYTYTPAYSYVPTYSYAPSASYYAPAYSYAPAYGYGGYYARPYVSFSFGSSRYHGGSYGHHHHR